MAIDGDSESGMTIENEKEATPRPPLSDAAKRALEEAQERRLKEAETDKPVEIGGRGGKDPARFGDWEVKGIASDF